MGPRQYVFENLNSVRRANILSLGESLRWRECWVYRSLANLIGANDTHADGIIEYRDLEFSDLR